ncbi:MAG: hypothetical protein ACKOEL_00030 [Planctomycetota bacterium]
MAGLTDSLVRLAAPCLTALVTAAAAVAQPPAPIAAWDPGSQFVVDATLPEALNTGCRFGFAMAMTNEYAVIGAPDVKLVNLRTGIGTNGAGAAFVFKRNGVTGTWEFLVRLIAPTAQLNQAGCAVAIDPSTNDIVIGAWASDAVAPFGGAAFVYKKGSGDDWGTPALAQRYGNLTRVPTQVLAPEELQSIDQFGFSVAAAGGTISVGCPLDGTSNTGAIYVFDRDGDGNYQFAQKLTDEAAGANDQLGTKLAASGNLLVAGVQNDDVEGRINAGSALVFRRSGGDWSLARRLTAASPATGAGFGSSVAVADTAGDDWIAVGAPAQSSGRTTAVAGNGAATVHRSIDGGLTWLLDATLLPRSDNVNNSFGFSVAMTQANPPQVVVGSPGFDTAIPSIEEPAQLVQVINTGAGFTFVRNAGTWAIRGTGDKTGDAWAPSALPNSSMGRSVAVGPTAAGLCLVGAETPTGSLGTVYPFEFRVALVGTGDGQVAGAASGPLDADGNPSDGSTPGTGGGGTGGGVPGGGTPSPGITTGPGAVVIPLTPIVYDWGLIKGTAVALSGRSVHLLQTDGKHRAQRPEFRLLGELPVGASYVGTGDMNGDLSGDIVFVAPGEVLKFWKRDGFTILDTATIDTLPAGFDAITVADVDADRKPDVLLQGVVDPRQLRVWHIDAGAISSSDEYELPQGDWSVFTGNFRTRNATDILIRDRQTGVVRVLVPGEAAGDATFPVVVRRPASARLAGFGDMDGNGQPDIFWQADDIEVDLMDQDDDGNYFASARRRTGLAKATIVNVRDWNDDGTVDFWMRRGDRNYIQYGKVVNRWMYGGGSRDLRNAPGTVVDVADR